MISELFRGRSPALIISAERQSLRRNIQNAIARLRYSQIGAIQNEAWFIHGVNDNVTFLAQQETSEIRGSIQTKEGVVGKSWPFQRIGPVRMVPVTSRDADTTYINPPQDKRRARLVDRNAGVLLDEFDEVKELINPKSTYARLLVMSREVELDYLSLNIAGLDSAGAAQTAIGGIMGLASTVDEAAETTGTVALPATSFIANGGFGGTMTKLRTIRRRMAEANVRKSGKVYFFYSPAFIDKLLTDPTVTSMDFNPITSLQRGTFRKDEQWMGMYWRESTVLPKVGNIRSCVAVHEDAAGLAIGLIKEIHVAQVEGKWGNWHALCKLSAGVVRVDDAGVQQCDIDESV